MTSLGHNGGPDWANLESDLHQAPLFPVEAPDGRKDLSEHERQAWFVSFMRKSNPHIEIHANMNHGKRGQFAMNQAHAEGLKPGVFDITVAWDVADAADDRPTVAWCEYKGYERSGRAGKLSQIQIDWGNAMHRKGFSVACFFSAWSCIEWLRSLGCPIRGKVQ
jgi:hypothetical protein